jgi:hypothetical protein
MFPNPLVVLLRLFHIGAGVFWVGGVLMFSRFLFPAAQALGPAAGPVMNHMTQVLKMPRALLGGAFMTIATGFLLYWNASVGFQPAWMRSVTGMTFGFGAVMAIAAVVVGLMVNAPTANRIGALGGAIMAGGGKPSPEQAAEMKQLQSRLGGALKAVTALLMLATAAMATARYL